MSDFPIRLKKAMRYRGFRQTDLATATGIDRGTMSNYLKGKYKPKTRNVIAIADTLKVNARWLLGNDDTPMEIDPKVDYITTELDYYKTAYIKLEYSDVVESNVTQEEWCTFYDKFDKLTENFKVDILKYMYLVFAMHEMIETKKQ